MLDPLALVILIFVFILGLALGSFASALQWRLPMNKPFAYEKNPDTGVWEPVRSQCPSCGATLGAIDLIPLLSWLMFRGKCRRCHSKISVVYPFLEVVAGLLAVTGLILLGLTIWFLIFLISLPFILAYLLINLRKIIR